jgi:hypothetical protein
MSSRPGADLDLYRDDWSTRHAEEMQVYADRMRQLEEDHKAWLAGYLKEISGAADEPAPAHKPAQQEPTQDASDIGEPAAPVPQVPAGRPDPYAADRALAREIADMPMYEYAKRRAELGVRSATDMRHLFRESR